PIASSMITQMMPAITNDQLTQLPTARLLPLHVPRTIASVRLVFNDSSCETAAEKIVKSPLHEGNQKRKRSYLLRFFEARRGLRFDFFAGFFGFSAAASSRRFFAAQPGLLICRPRAIPNPSEGTFSVI